MGGGTDGGKGRRAGRRAAALATSAVRRGRGRGRGRWRGVAVVKTNNVTFRSYFIRILFYILYRKYEYNERGRRDG